MTVYIKGMVYIKKKYDVANYEGKSAKSYASLTKWPSIASQNGGFSKWPLFMKK